MESTANRAIAIVGAAAVLPEAPNLAAFWENVKRGRYCITAVPPERWDSAFYYDPDPAAPDKTYSKIGGWVREFVWDPMRWRLPIPPRVAAGMDDAQKWGIACTRDALEDYGFPKRSLNLERTAVILGNAMAGEKHYLTALRVFFPEYAHELADTPEFAKLPESTRREITDELHRRMNHRLPEVTEDSMPGELANCIAGRIANLYNFRGPNFITDAACASAMAAITAACEGLIGHDFDYAITGGIDRNMGAPTFVKFCKIGALSPTGSRPYAEGADGFVMGEGAVIFLLKRLADAERDGDNVYAVIRGIAGSSDGRGKGITAPNPVGQRICVERAWQNAGLSPATVTLIEGHGTSTRVGDVVEVQSVTDVLKSCHVPAGSVALGSVKSNIGHLKGAAGAAGLLKATLALHEKALPPNVNFERPNPDIDFAHSPLRVNTELRPWDVPPDVPRRAGVSAFGFGGTNFHAVLEEYLPGRLGGNGNRSATVSVPMVLGREAPMEKKEAAPSSLATSAQSSQQTPITCKKPLRGALVIGASSQEEVISRLHAVLKAASDGHVPAAAAPLEPDLRGHERVAIDYGNPAELADKCAKALKAFASSQPLAWKALRAQGVYRGQGIPPKVAFLYTGQGSQYVNMMSSLRATESIVADTFVDADRALTLLLGKPLSEYIFVNDGDRAAIDKAEGDLRQTAITQPAVLATDISITRLLAAYGIHPDMTMGHSLGEYGALVAAGALPFEDALEAVSARGREMTRVSLADNGRMAAVFAPLPEIERILKTIDGYIVTANINSERQAVIGGASKAVEEAMEQFHKAGYTAVALPVSHAFHTSIVAPASEPLRQTLQRLHLRSPQIPIVANVDGEFYPTGPDAVPKMMDILARQIAAPVQFVKGLRTLYEAGARVFVETGPKKALHGFVQDVLGDRGDVVALFTNHPKLPDAVAFNQALCGLYAAGLGRGVTQETERDTSTFTTAPHREPAVIAGPPKEMPAPAPASAGPGTSATPQDLNQYTELGRLFAEAIERGSQLIGRRLPKKADEPVLITGAALGLPGTDRIFDDNNVGRILRGDQFISRVPQELRRAMLDKNITRLVKSDNGGPVFESISDVADVIKLAGRGGSFDIDTEFGMPEERTAALDRVTALAIGAGIDALRDAGIPLVMRYKTTTKGTLLPERWGLPEPMRDDTGVIFASAFPGYDSFADEMQRHYADHERRQLLALLESLCARVAQVGAQTNGILQELEIRIERLRSEIEAQRYVLDRRFLFRVLSMGHSQFAEFIGARGPNTQINSACATTTQAIALAQDWIDAGRCRRVIILSADDVTSDHLMEWIGAGFLASGAAATDDTVENAAIPFDKRRHGMIVGMGAAAMVIESAEAAHERGIQAICEVLSTVTANSAFHGSRLDVQHISGVMEQLIHQAESRFGLQRAQIAPRAMFMSHETYTPARGGSASAEIFALRRVFGEAADKVVIANTKGFTGHAMATGIEDVVAIKALETGIVPPVANFKEVDPELGELNLSKGGSYPVEYAVRLGAGFGSQISMVLLRRVNTRAALRPQPSDLGYEYRIIDPAVWNDWLKRMSGKKTARLEIVQRTLRVHDEAAVRMSEPVPEPRVMAARAAAGPQGSPDTSELKADIAPATPQAPGLQQTATTASESTPVVAIPKPAPVPAAVPLEATVPAAITTEDRGSIKDTVLGLVSEKTGYPIDMLDLDLDLEADLGIDTVKQAEVFATIREAYGIVRDDKVRLRDFPTLAHVIGFVEDRVPKVAESAATSSGQKAEPASQPSIATATVTSTANFVDAASVAESVKERILSLVVEKTGYPKDMLDFDLDLEADLGVDTVKQAELFAAIREVYAIARDPNLKLRDFPTLAHVIRFVYDRRPDLVETVNHPASMESLTASTDLSISEIVPKETLQPAIPAIEPKAEHADAVKERILALVAEKTGYPKDMLDLDLDLEADLGIDTVKQAEMFAAIREIYDIPRDPNLKLRDFPTLALVIQFVHDRRPDLAPRSAAKPSTSGTEIPAQHAMVSAPEAPAQTDETKPTDMAEARFAVVSDEEIKNKVLDIVAAKTGYPKDMLDLDLDLEADLGVDTVKQAEMFADVRAAYNIARDPDLKLRDFPTLAHVIQFAKDKVRSGTAGAKPSAEQMEITLDHVTEDAAPAAPHPAFPQRKVASFAAADSIPRRVPVPVPRPQLAACKPTGVTLGSGSRVVVMADSGGVGVVLRDLLLAMSAEVLFITSGSESEAAQEQLKAFANAGPVDGVYWLPALDYEGSLEAMSISEWKAAVNLRLKALYEAMRVLYHQIAGLGTFLFVAVRLGGQHGYDEQGAIAPIGGAVTGFAKTYKRERPDALVKAVDFEAEATPERIAHELLAETFHDCGAVEISYKGGQRWTIGLHEQPAADGQQGLVLDEETVFLVTGAAGSIVSAITADLAAASGGIFYLLDVVPEPDPSNPDLKRFKEDRDGLKRELFSRIQARGERATPALVERELASIERARAANAAIQAVRAAGGSAYYFNTNLTNSEAVFNAVTQIRERSGRIDVLLHAAGMERSHFLPDKSRAEFDLVFDVKSDGWFNLLHAIGDMPLGATVAFSSIAGRFGNAGQSDYSSANDLLCKITSSFRNTRPNTRGIVIDWTAWGGIGMATRGSIPKMMEIAGIEMLPPEAGVPTIRRELTVGGTRGELVIGQKLGVLLNEWDGTGGLDTIAASANVVRGPMVERVVAAGIHSGVEVEVTLDPKLQPFLYDHQIDDTPVLPGVMGIEAFAEAALCLLPGWRLEAVEDVNFLAPFKFYRNEPRTISIHSKLWAAGETIVGECQLIGKRQLPNQSEPQTTTHFTGRVRLTRQKPEDLTASIPSSPITSNISRDAIYRIYFHGPAYQVIERAWRDGGQIIGKMAGNLPPNHKPEEMQTLTEPRLVELCFQTAGLWELGMRGRFGLPRTVDSIRVMSDIATMGTGVYAVVTPVADDAFDAEVIDAAGKCYVQLRGYRTVAVPNVVDVEPLKVLRAAA